MSSIVQTHPDFARACEPAAGDRWFCGGETIEITRIEGYLVYCSATDPRVPGWKYDFVRNSQRWPEIVAKTFEKGARFQPAACNQGTKGHEK